MDFFQFQKIIECFRREPRRTVIWTFFFLLFTVSSFLFWKYIDRISDPREEVYIHVRTAEEDAIDILKKHKAKIIFENGKNFLGQWKVDKPTTIKYLEKNGTIDKKDVLRFFTENDIYCTIDVTDTISSMIWLDLGTRPTHPKLYDPKDDDSPPFLENSCGGGFACKFFNDGKGLRSDGLDSFEAYFLDKERIYIDGDLEFYCVGMTFPRIYFKKIKQ